MSRTYEAPARIARELKLVDFDHKLSRPIRPHNGSMAILESLGDAARLIVELESFQSLPVWGKVASQLLQAAATGKKADILEATRMLEMALRRERAPL